MLYRRNRTPSHLNLPERSCFSQEHCDHEPLTQESHREKRNAQEGEPAPNRTRSLSLVGRFPAEPGHWTVSVPIMYPWVIIGPIMPIGPVPHGSRHRKV